MANARTSFDLESLDALLGLGDVEVSPIGDAGGELTAEEVEI